MKPKALKSWRELLADLVPKGLLASIRQSTGQSGNYYRYGLEDNVPNLIIEAVNDSPTARLCVDRLNQFVYGQGFVDERIKELESSPGVSISKFARQCIEYLNYIDGFVIQHKYNRAGQSARKYIVPLQYVRLRESGDYIYRPGYGDELGTFRNSFTNFIVPSYETMRKMSPAEIRKVVDAQTKQYGEQLGAFQYVYFPRVGQLYDKYPLPTHFSGLPDLRADAGLSLTEESIVGNNFKPQFVINSAVLDRNQKDAEDGMTEYERMVEEINRACSPDGSSVILLETNKPELLSVVPLDNRSRMDETERATERIQKKICRMFGVPPVLVGIDTQGKLGDNQELVNKFKLLNLTIVDKRNLLKRALVDAWPQFDESAFEIENLELFDYLPDKVVERLTDMELREVFQIPEVEGAEITPATPTTPEAEQREVNEMFANLTGRQLQNIQRIVRKFNKGELTKTQAAQMLESGYAMTPEQVDAWLIDESEEDGATA